MSLPQNANTDVQEMKRRHRDEFILAFQNRENKTQSLRSFWVNYPQDARPGYETARGHLKRLQEDPTHDFPKSTGRPNSLTADEEMEIAKRCVELLNQPGGVILTNAILKREALNIARIPRTDEGPDDVVKRCKRVGGYYWCRSFRQTYGFSKSPSKRVCLN